MLDWGAVQLISLLMVIFIMAPNTAGKNSVVVGYQNKTDNEDGTLAYGANNTAYGNSAFAIGNNRRARKRRGTKVSTLVTVVWRTC